MISVVVIPNLLPLYEDINGAYGMICPPFLSVGIELRTDNGKGYQWFVAIPK